ncbi:MAG TPA: amino acid adenylation domain-containing protein, partial [Pseudomonadales bacterium]|nr:amino acid adenylation domain-containing protein [Pseudomonadales bacterium]
SSAQKSIWFDQALHPDLPLYNIGLLAQFSGTVDYELLERALAEIASEHDALRIKVETIDGTPLLFIEETVDARLFRIDLSADAEPQVAAAAYIRSEFSQPFNYADLLWKLILIKVGENAFLLLNKFHHLIADGIGISLFGKALAERYNQLLLGNVYKEQNPPSYLSFIQDQNDYANSAKYLKDRDFWLTKMKAAPAALLSAKSGNKQSSSPFASEQCYWRVSRELFSTIELFSTNNGLSAVHFFTALIACYFGRIQDVDELVIGFPMHNRLSATQKNLLGMLVSVVPLFLKLNFASDFRQLMKDVGQEIRSGFKHQRFSIAELNRSLELTESGRKRLYDINFSFESFAADLTFGEAKLSVKPLHNGYEQVPLAIFVRDYHDDQAVDVAFDFNLAFFSGREIERIIESLERITNHILVSPDTPLADLPLLSAHETDQVLNQFNQRHAAYPVDKLIHELIEDQAARTPHNIALEFEDAHLTYAQLDAAAERLADALLAQGVMPDDRVGVCLHRSFEMVIGLLGILKAGAAYVPLEPSLPAERLAYMIEDSSPVAILVDSDTQNRISNLDQTKINLGKWLFEGESPQTSKREKSPALSSKILAYVLYTSGSTGKPKGVMNQHDAVVNRLFWAQKEYRVTSAERILQKTPFSFDVSVWEFFLPLISGATLVIAPPNAHQDPEWLQRIITEKSISMLHFVPSMLSAFLSQFNRVQDKTPIQKVLCSGEALPYSLQQRFFQLLPGVELHNLYGPTEAAVDVTFWRCDSASKYDFVPIGFAADNVQIYILDRRMRPVPVGAVGEIYIGGIQVARGYLNRPELTLERFISNPFLVDEHNRLYKTGDLGRWLENGAVEYLGRNDFQIKIRGFRIELGEIETALANFPGVREAIVIAREDQPNDKRLVAYVIPAENASLNTDEIHAYLAEQLTSYMVPSAFVVLDSFPVNANGKLDRKALPAPDRAAVVGSEYEPPQGELEHTIAIICQEVLGLEKVGRHDNFFRCGGHSLAALQLLSRLRERENVELSLRDIFSHPTISELAALATTSKTECYSVERIGRDEPLKLSWSQQRLWFLHQLDAAASAAYQMSTALKIEGPLDVTLLQDTLNRVIARHESLRTCFYQV